MLVISSSRRKARGAVAVQSIAEAHPAATVEVVWTDPRLSSSATTGVVLPHGLEVHGARWTDLVLMAGEHKAAWAAMPWLVDAAAPRADGGPIVVIDDTFVVLRPLDGLLATSSGPVARAARSDGELAWGGPLPGMVVIQGDAEPLTDWWRARVGDWLGGDAPIGHSGADRSAGSSSPWWQPVDALTLCTDARFRLAASTAGELELSLTDGGVVTVDDTDEGSVALADLAGLQPDSPWWFAVGSDLPTRSVGSSDGLRSLCAQQSERLIAHGWTPEQDHDELCSVPGLALTPEIRAWCRSRHAAGDPVPNPYVTGEVSAFVEALAAPGRADGTGVSVISDLIYDARPDVQHAFGSPRWRDRDSFRQWLWTSALSEGAVSLSTLPQPPRPSMPAVRSTGPKPFGVNLVGYLGAELGLGVAARQMQQALGAAGVPTATVTYDRTASLQGRRSDGSTDRPYHFNLMLIVPDQLSLFVGDVGPGFLADHHNIGLWYWESDVMSPTQLPAFDYVDEVWSATTYLQESFRSAQRAPVSLVPSPLVFDVAPTDRSDRHRFGLDDRFTYLFSFDFLSVVERKNPLGLVEAYRRAYGPGDGTRLVLKSINGEVFPRERERVAAAISDRDDIELWDRMLPAADRLGLVAAADCYVSLHRAEGLGLTMAEAMAAGTPVIATGYSGNLDFMDDASALLVPYELVEVGAGSHYPAQGHWADPDLDVAAQFLHEVRVDPVAAERRALAAKAALSRFSYEPVGLIARDRLLAAWNAARQG